ncbi:MAG: aldehyde dehydrogenase EutE, partial [Luteolibacter sp.]
MKTLDSEAIRSVVENVISRLGTPAPAEPATSKPADCACHKDQPPAPQIVSGGGRIGQHGVFDCVTKAADAAHNAHLRLKSIGIEGRNKVIDIVKHLAVSNAVPWGTYEMNETKIGRLDHKIGKLEITKNVPGTEWLKPYALSGDGGITLEEYAPFGVIGAIT